jgi:hypothetical protein
MTSASSPSLVAAWRGFVKRMVEMYMMTKSTKATVRNYALILFLAGAPFATLHAQTGNPGAAGTQGGAAGSGAGVGTAGAGYGGAQQPGMGAGGAQTPGGNGAAAATPGANGAGGAYTGTSNGQIDNTGNHGGSGSKAGWLGLIGLFGLLGLRGRHTDATVTTRDTTAYEPAGTPRP